LTTFLVHGKVRLALHTLRPGAGRPLLLLHGLGESAELAARAAGKSLKPWPGPVLGLDLTGHGSSSVPRGGGYTAEVLMADADTALAHLGPATILGRGLGAYVALLLAGARPREVRGAILCDGPGLAGGGARPGSGHVDLVREEGLAPPDPYALAELSRDPRPADYATSFVRQATHLSDLSRPITVCAREQPEWLRAVVEEPGVEQATLEEALGFYSSAR
jgi:pimeloyl-ACP methyl ester carboxylesterase